MARRPDVSRLAAELADADIQPSVETWATSTLRVLLRAIPAVSASFNEINLPAGRVTGWIEPPFTDAELALLPTYQAHQSENPLLRNHRETGSLRAHRWCDVDPDGDIRRTTLYREFYARLGVDDQLGLALATPPGAVVAIVLNRTEATFSERERDLLDALQPFLAAGYRAARQRSLGDRFEQLAVADGWAVIVVDDQGLIERADGFTARPGDPPFALGGALPEPMLSWFEGLAHATRFRGMPTELTALEMAPGMRFEVRAVFGAVAPHMILARVPPEVLPIPALAAAGLSPREAQVAAALATGATNRQIAGQLGIAEGTVRKHLERVYKCLGVDNRAAAVAVIMTLALTARP